MDTTKPQIGDIIGYTLPSHLQPTNPGKIWHGRVRMVHGDMVMIDNTDSGYETLSEYVNIAQIVEIERSQEP